MDVCPVMVQYLFRHSNASTGVGKCKSVSDSKFYNRPWPSLATDLKAILFILQIARHAGLTLSWTPMARAFDHTGLASGRNRTPTRPLGFTLLRSLRSNHAGDTKTAIGAFVTRRLGVSAVQSACPTQSEQYSG